ncbi:MAG TPA: NIPSNAP family protein [Terracidiphilus sp.]
MHRRKFLSASLAASAAAVLPHKSAAQTPAMGRDYYLLRRYSLVNGPQQALTERFIADALIPALTRRGMGPVGAFSVNIGPETPTYCVLIPSHSVDDLATLDLGLAKDAEFMKAAAPFWSAPATAPAFVRTDSTLLAAFEGWPRITPPEAAPAGTKRVYQLRTYESPSYADHVRKVEMFHAGEFDLFKAAGFHNVFFGDTLVGTRTPSLTYMLSFNDLTELNAHWAAFSGNPEWKKLSSDPKYAYEQIVSNITNLILSPLSCSQI